MARSDKPGLEYAYREYVFAVSTANSAKDDAPAPAPESFRWGSIARDADIALVRSRTAIPLRAPRTLRDRVVDGDAPVAWAFLGPDDSLIWVHVELGYHGRGLAKAVGRRALRTGVGRASATCSSSCSAG